MLERVGGVAVGRYALRINGKGKLVAQPGSLRSYTGDPQKAQRFDTLEEAERQRCGNEEIVDLFRVLFG